MLTMLDVAKAVHGQHSGDNPLISGVSTDSRIVERGNLFVALRGERFDGHQFVADAAQNGALGALVDNPIEIPMSRIVVDDTESALGQLAAHWRRRFSIPLVAVTGSNGKTTVKEMIGRILGSSADTLVSRGNFNNPIGLPLSLLKLRQQHQFAVVEIGMNQVGEIERLAEIAGPTVAVITNAGAAHLERLTSVSQVATEKGKIISALGKDGVAVLNRDSEYFPPWCAAAGSREIITFGFTNEADISATCKVLDFGSEIRIRTPRGNVNVKLQLAAEHNVINALAATAVGIALGVSLKNIKSGLESMTAVAGRLQLREHLKGGVLIDDTYNANPNSVAAALTYLSGLSGDRRLVFGDMFELGSNDEQFHREIGRKARRCGIGRLYALGALSAFAAREFGRGARHYSDKDALIKDLRDELDATTTLLVKGSRGMKMDQVADQLCVRSDGPSGEA